MCKCITSFIIFLKIRLDTQIQSNNYLYFSNTYSLKFNFKIINYSHINTNSIFTPLTFFKFKNVFRTHRYRACTIPLLVRFSYLTPTNSWNKVLMPAIKTAVDKIYAWTGSSRKMHSFGVKTFMTKIIPPIVVIAF